MESASAEALREHWSDLIQRGEVLHFHPGQVLCYEDHAPYGLFVIKQGVVECQRGGKPCTESHFWQSPDGKQVIGIHHLAEGAILCCTCTATSDCEVLFLSKSEILPLLQGPLEQVS